MNNTKTSASEKQLTAKSLIKAIKLMGLSKSDLSDILMTSESKLNKLLNSGIESDSTNGQAALLIINVYRSLYGLSGNNKSFMHHFLYTENKYFDQRPIDTMKFLDGLVKVNDYLNAMGEKV